MRNDKAAYTETIIREVFFQTETATVTVHDHSRPNSASPFAPSATRDPYGCYPPNCWEAPSSSLDPWSPMPSESPCRVEYVWSGYPVYMKQPGLMAGLFFAGFGSALLIAGLVCLWLRLRRRRLRLGLQRAVLFDLADEEDDGVEKAAARTSPHIEEEQGGEVEDEPLLGSDSSKTSWESCKTSFQRLSDAEGSAVKGKQAV